MFLILKEDIIDWYQKLNPSCRLEVMCTLLDVCLPFELRFLGTMIENLARKDFHELRDSEYKANNSKIASADKLNLLATLAESPSLLLNPNQNVNSFGGVGSGEATQATNPNQNHIHANSNHNSTTGSPGISPPLATQRLSQQDQQGNKGGKFQNPSTITETSSASRNGVLSKDEVDGEQQSGKKASTSTATGPSTKSKDLLLETPLLDDTIRRKLTLWISLLSATNIECAKAYFKVLSDVEKLFISGTIETLEKDILEEFSLLYTVSHYHPAFSFDQRTFLSGVLSRIRGLFPSVSSSYKCYEFPAYKYQQQPTQIHQQVPHHHPQFTPYYFNTTSLQHQHPNHIYYHPRAAYYQPIALPQQQQQQQQPPLSQAQAQSQLQPSTTSQQQQQQQQQKQQIPVNVNVNTKGPISTGDSSSTAAAGGSQPNASQSVVTTTTSLQPPTTQLQQQQQTQSTLYPMPITSPPLANHTTTTVVDFGKRNASRVVMEVPQREFARGSAGYFSPSPTTFINHGIPNQNPNIINYATPSPAMIATHPSHHQFVQQPQIRGRIVYDVGPAPGNSSSNMSNADFPGFDMGPGSIEDRVDGNRPRVVSCYNCGQQGHYGSECHELSLHEVTKSLYSINFAPPNQLQQQQPPVNKLTLLTPKVTTVTVAPPQAKSILTTASTSASTSTTPNENVTATSMRNDSSATNSSAVDLH